MIRLNILLPEEVANQLHPIKNKSRFIAQAVLEKIERDRQQKLEKEMMEGYKAQSNEDGKVNADWSIVDSDGLGKI